MENEDEFKSEKCNDASLKLLTELDANSYRVTQRADQGSGNLQRQILNKSRKISFLLRQSKFHLCGGNVSDMSDKLGTPSEKRDYLGIWGMRAYLIGIIVQMGPPIRQQTLH